MLVYNETFDVPDTLSGTRTGWTGILLHNKKCLLKNLEFQNATRH